MPPARPNVLAVEGVTDMHALIALLNQHVVWGDVQDRVADVEVLAGKQQFTSGAALGLILKDPRRTRIGLVLDADDDPTGTWQGVRNKCVTVFPSISPTPACDVWTGIGGRRLGVWLMPDNGGPGTLEDFLGALVPHAQRDQWLYADEVVAHARTIGAPYRDAHRHKARLYSWLAWRDEPGNTFASAIRNNDLTGLTPARLALVEWFCRLFEVPLRPAS